MPAAQKSSRKSVAKKPAVNRINKADLQSKVKPVELPSESLITSRAMLASLKISVWTARKHDKKISDQVAEQHGASKDIGRYNKQLIAKKALAKITTLATRARTIHYELTLPWMDDGSRILSGDLYFDHQAKIGKLIEEFNQAADEFALQYPALRAEAMQMAGTLIDPDEYPCDTCIREKFSMRVNVLPMPSAADFRVALGDKDVDRIRKNIETQMNETFAGAMRDAWQRLHAAVANMAQKLTSYRPASELGKVESPFRDSLVENMRELCDLLPHLNITQDANLDRMTREVREKLGHLDAEVLRTDAAKRKETAAAAQSILGQMSGYMS